MSNSNNVFKEYLNSKSKFFILKPGEEKKVRFLFAKSVPNHFDSGKTNCLRIHFEEDGTEKMWDRVSRKLAEQMMGVTEGSWISIKRFGEKGETTYEIKTLQ